MEHFKRLGALRKKHEALRLGDIHFFAAEDKHIGFTRSYNGKTLKIYINRSADIWEIPTEKILLGYNLQLVAEDWLTIGPRGFIITEV
jgi:glycosidase